MTDAILDDLLWSRLAARRATDPSTSSDAGRSAPTGAALPADPVGSAYASNDTCETCGAMFGIDAGEAFAADVEVHESGQCAPAAHAT